MAETPARASSVATKPGAHVRSGSPPATTAGRQVRAGRFEAVLLAVLGAISPPLCRPPRGLPAAITSGARLDGQFPLPPRVSPRLGLPAFPPAGTPNPPGRPRRPAPVASGGRVGGGRLGGRSLTTWGSRGSRWSPTPASTRCSGSRTHARLRAARPTAGGHRRATDRQSRAAGLDRRRDARRRHRVGLSHRWPRISAAHLQPTDLLGNCRFLRVDFAHRTLHDSPADPSHYAGQLLTVDDAGGLHEASRGPAKPGDYRDPPLASRRGPRTTDRRPDPDLDQGPVHRQRAVRL